MNLILLILVFETVGKKTCLIAAETGYAHQSPQLETATEEKYLLISCFCEEGLLYPHQQTIGPVVATTRNPGDKNPRLISDFRNYLGTGI